jgi:HTH-type transcriptional regulator / antitoxin HigA
MNIRPIRKNAGYEWALQEVEPYFKNPPAVGSEDADRFDVLSALLKRRREL